jgi:hypothetical protein
MLTDQQVMRLARRATGGDVAEVGPFEQGGPNVRWVRPAGGGPRLVLKWWPANERPVPALRRARQWASVLEAAGWPFPRCLSVSQFDEYSVVVEEHLRGRHPADITPAVVRQMLSMADRARGRGEPNHGWLRALSGNARRGGKVRVDVLRAHPVGAELLRRLAAALATVDGARFAPSDVVHGDFSPGNVLVADGAVVGVVDWDGAGPGDTAFDLVTLEWDLALWGRGVRDHLPDITTALDRIGEPDLLRVYRLYHAATNLSWSVGTPDEAAVVGAWRDYPAPA